MLALLQKVRVNVCFISGSTFLILPPLCLFQHWVSNLNIAVLVKLNKIASSQMLCPEVASLLGLDICMDICLSFFPKNLDQKLHLLVHLIRYRIITFHELSFISFQLIASILSSGFQLERLHERWKEGETASFIQGACARSIYYISKAISFLHLYRSRKVRFGLQSSRRRIQTNPMFKDL